MNPEQELLRQLPQIEKALRWPAIADLVATFSRPEVTRVLQECLASLRQAILDGCLAPEDVPSCLEEAAICERLRASLEIRETSAYRRVINGTGIVLHTGLGRAPLPAAARDAFSRELAGYSLVELAADTGERNEREAALRGLLRELTGAESATVVNNNAAATLLILAGLARGREVIISRGQLVEIGGSFRIPEIMEESGARLIEVGSTNRTHLADYARAISEHTSLLLRVHTSNYEIRGFTSQPTLEELVDLGRQHSITVVSDLGSGCFTDLSELGFRREPLVEESIKAGADLACFSGDKLLGGPQCGIIVGREALVRRLRSHPLFRALRVDKTTLLLLESTLKLYRRQDNLREHVPVLRLLSMGAEEIRARVDRFHLRASTASGDSQSLQLGVVRTFSAAGSGSLPAQQLPSWALSLTDSRGSAEQLCAELRKASPPVFARVKDDRVLLDFRTVLSEDEDELLKVLLDLRVR